jgi:hypothetical protein
VQISSEGGRVREPDITAPLPPPRRRERWLLVLLLVVLPLLVAEAGVQGLIAFHRIPPAAGHFRAIDVKWVNLQRADPSDIILMGPSTVNSGIDPAVLARLAGEEAGREVHAFNLGIPGLGKEFSLVEQLEREGRLPSVIVIGISPGTQGGDGVGGEGPFQASPMGRLFSRCQARGVDSFVETVDCQAALVSSLWRWRGRPRELLTGLVRGMPRSFGKVHRRRADGFTEGMPRRVHRIEAQVPVGLEREDGRTGFNQGAVRAYARIARFLEERGSRLVGVSIPYAPPYMDAIEERYPGYRASWSEALRQLSEEADFPIVDTGGFGDWWGDGSSQNVKHLSREGAEDFTEQLWETPTFRDAVMDALEEPPASR